MTTYKNCQDCGLPLKGKSCESGWSACHSFPKDGEESVFHSWMKSEQHFMVCCDCYDETQGMSAKGRSVPRPK